MELPKSYNHESVEAKWYKHWIDSGAFEPAPWGGAVLFHRHPAAQCHGFTAHGPCAEQYLAGLLCRYQRMDGIRVLWVPGTDHAGIATQNVVERRLPSARS